MSRPRPKFCAGEEVMLCSKNSPELNGRCEVVALGRFQEYRNISGDRISARWGYWLSIQHSNGNNWAEDALRKLPPEDRASWEGMIWNPLKEGEPA